MFITTATAIYSRGHGLHTLTAVPRLTQPSTPRGTVKWVSALGLGTNKMEMVDVDGSCHFFLADSQSKSVGLDWGLAATSGAYSALIKWTGWTLAMALPWWQHHKYHLGYYYYLRNDVRADDCRTSCHRGWLSCDSRNQWCRQQTLLTSCCIFDNHLALCTKPSPAVHSADSVTFVGLLPVAATGCIAEMLPALSESYWLIY